MNHLPVDAVEQPAFLAHAGPAAAAADPRQKFIGVSWKIRASMHLRSGAIKGRNSICLRMSRSSSIPGAIS
ncbi:MAG: hypothetical protein AAB380_08720, partial [Verrucomicrobiota bacterium]